MVLNENGLKDEKTLRTVINAAQDSKVAKRYIDKWG